MSIPSASKISARPTVRRKPLNRATISDQIYAQLCLSLASGELAPGERLSIRKVAATLGVSMMPVREAITRLIVDNALEILPNKAVRVPIMTTEIFRELTSVRIHIEGFAAEQAAIHRTDEELDLIKEQEVAFRDAVTSSNPSKIEALRANKNLHFIIYRASHLPTLLRITEMLWLRVGPIINLDLDSSVVQGAKTALAQHARLVHAIQTRDAATARDALAADLLGTANFVLESTRLRENNLPLPLSDFGH
ncbi:GntR family transcriptional regulator [Bradyrhizobium sp. URHD0069]|uniref:GntR family transcriptional regulator n=1 Tax=Bradyrhizobium sp. URHD0069 TaxID=1380355 RepID=UPI00068BCDB1|nr:GntR family transcriptional regulator [Bradyrhizobium sp. URHD0069]